MKSEVKFWWKFKILTGGAKNVLFCPISKGKLQNVRQNLMKLGCLSPLPQTLHNFCLCYSVKMIIKKRVYSLNNLTTNEFHIFCCKSCWIFDVKVWNDRRWWFLHTGFPQIRVLLRISPPFWLNYPSGLHYIDSVCVSSWSKESEDTFC